MKSIKINDIEVLYDDLEEQQINYIKDIINHNYSLFVMVLESTKIISLSKADREDAIHVTNFDNFFKQIVNEVYQNEYIKQQFENEDVLPGLYIEYLMRKLSKEEKTLVESKFNIDDSMLYSFIAYKYYEVNGTFDKFVEYLKDRKDTDKILSWLETNRCFDAYNYLLKITTNFLTSNDFYFLQNISQIVYKMLWEAFHDAINQKDEEKVELSKISPEVLDNLFSEFLHYINAPEAWFEVYQKLKDNNLITFIKSDNETDDSVCYKDTSDILRITITTDGTIRSFWSLVHEFCHYIAMQNDINTEPFSITEFPSIFFEKLAGIFLTNKGYQTEVTNAVTKSRKENNIEIYLGLLPLFIDIVKYSKEGYVGREEKIKFQREQIRILRETRKKLMEIEINAGLNPNPEDYKTPNYDVEKLVDTDCQMLVNCFVENGLLVLNGYQYLFSTFLAEKILKMSEEDDTVISKMIMITDNVSVLKVGELTIGTRGDIIKV